MYLCFSFSNGRMLSTPPLPHPHAATNAFSPEGNHIEVSHDRINITVGFIFLAIFTTFFFIGVVFLYFQNRSSSSVLESDDHGQAASDPVTLRSLAMVTMVTEMAGECTICLEEVGEGETVKMITHCKHIFHPDCIERWLENQVTCPVCRYSERSGEVELVTVGGGEEEDAEVSMTNLE